MRNAGEEEEENGRKKNANCDGNSVNGRRCHNPNEKGNETVKKAGLGGCPKLGHFPIAYCSEGKAEDKGTQNYNKKIESVLVLIKLKSNLQLQDFLDVSRPKLA